MCDPTGAQVEWTALLWARIRGSSIGKSSKVTQDERRVLRCAIYTRKSTEEGLEQDFNSLDAQREACEAYIKSQAHEGWRLVQPTTTTVGSPAARWIGRRCKRSSSISAGHKVDVVVVYKVDRLTRSLGRLRQAGRDFDAQASPSSR